MLNLTKISKDEEIKLVHFINKRKSLAKFLFLSALLVGYFSYVFYQPKRRNAFMRDISVSPLISS